MKIFTEAENQAWSKTLPSKMSSACTAIVAENQVLMVKAGYKDHWTFPSGIVDANESPKTAALRETSEEVGINLTASDCKLLSVIYTEGVNGDRDRFNFAFIVSLPTQKITFKVPNDEIEKAEWVNFDEVAAKSGNKGSYVKLQLALLGELSDGHYTEVHPTVK